MHHTVNTFCEAISNEIKTKTERKTTYNNLKKSELQALDELQTRDDIVITRADKGGAVVIMDVDDYVAEGNRQLSDKNFYKKLNHDPTPIYAERINNTIEQFKDEGLISETVAEGLKVHNPKTSNFYLNPKIHKEGTPGRPVISSIQCHSSNISKYVDYHLQPEVAKLKSYTKDSTDAINKLIKIKDEVEEDDILVTMDVRSLYTNIPNEEGIRAVREKLNASPSRIPSRIITTFLLLILTLNNFVFNAINYLQILGCAMGTKCSASYANIFMGWFEETFIYTRILDRTRIFLRYIDDVFFIWKGTETELKTFFEEINQVHPTIKFDHNHSKSEIHFLDLTVYKDKAGKLATKVHTKSTDRQAYLHKNSAHPSHLKKSIPYGQALRLKRICTEDDEFMKASIQLTEKLKKRGYDEKEINDQINRVEERNREELLRYKTKEPMTRIPCVLTYNPQLPNIKEAISNYWKILHINPQLKEIFDQQPIMAFRRNKNLGDIIGQKTINNGKVIRKNNIKNRKGWCSPCNTRNFNLCCRQVRSTNKFKSNRTNEEFKIYHRVSCKSKFIIYLLECILCRIQYIGKSEWAMNIRINKHRNDVFREEAIHVCQHFKQVTHNFNRHAKITIIEELKQQNKGLTQMRAILEEREDFWIQRLKTLHPDGFNKGLNRYK